MSNYGKILVKCHASFADMAPLDDGRKVGIIRAMDDGPGLPDGIGSHEFRELELMFSGKKPLAMFIDEDPGNFIIPEDDFEPHVRAETFVKREVVYQEPNNPYAPRFIYYALPQEPWRIEKLHAINNGDPLRKAKSNRRR